MSFSRSGTPAPPFSYPVGTGVFTDVLVSNTVFSTYFRGDGGFLSNVNSSIPGTLPNLVVSNSLTTTNVSATRYYGDGGLLSNITASGSVSGNLLSNLNASNLAFGVVNPSLVYGNTLSNLQFTNVTGFQSNTLSNLSASNLAFGVVNPSLVYGNTLSNLQFTNVTGFQSNTLSNLSASNLAFGVISPGLIYGNLISNINSSNLVQPFTNLVVSNTISTTNVLATTGNVGTLNVWRVSNLANLIVSNTVSTTNVSASSSLTVGPATLGINVFVFSNSSGGSNLVIMNNLGNVGIGTTNPGYLLDVGSTVNISTGSGGETIRSKGPLVIGNGVNDGNRFISALDSSLTAGNARYIVFGKTNSLYNQAELSYVHAGDGLTTNRMDIGFMGVSTITFLAKGTVGIGLSNPSATLHVIGNVYASNSITTTNVVCTSVNSVNPISFRNRVINGDFIIDQRNGGAATTPSAGTTRTIDRWKVEISGSGRCQMGQNLGAVASPPGFTSYYGLKVTTTTAVGAGDYLFFGQIIEGINTVDWQFATSNAKPITMSFWVYSSIAGTGGGFIRNAGASAGNYSRSYPFTFTISNTNTWEQKTVTIPGDTGGPWYAGQVDGLEFGIELWNGSNWQGAPGVWAATNYTGPTGGTINYAGTLNSYLYITGVQIEQGLVATPFERRHLGLELELCMRYYETAVARLGGYNTTGQMLRSSVYFNTRKRPAPSPTFTVISTPESSNLGSLNLDNSNYDQGSARILAAVTATGDAYGQWKISVDADF